MKKHEDGSIIIIATFSMVVLLSVCALTIDVGRVYIEKSRLQSAVDSAVLAAAHSLPDTAEATSSANTYFEQNGYDPADLNLTINNNRIEASSTKTIEYTFAKILGKNSASITASAASEKDSVGGAFGYALFSGSENSDISLSGSNLYIGGSTHSNRHFYSYCSSATITGACEASSLITINGSSINIPNRFPNSSVIEMPDFSEAVKNIASNQGAVYYGNQSFSGTEFNFDEAVYVDGDISFNTSKLTGTGTICATGNINFSGSSLNMTTDGAVCFYSTDGNIQLNGSSINIDGILYAQNGSINIYCSTLNVNGRIIGKSISMGLSSLSVIAGADDLDCLPSSGGVLLVE